MTTRLSARKWRLSTKRLPRWGLGRYPVGIDDQPLSHYYQAIDAGPLISQEELAQLLPLLVSPDRGTVLMHYTLTGTSQEATANVKDVLHVVEEANESDDFVVLIGGDASTAYENNELAEQDLQQGERFGVPVALLVLLVLFGAVVATLLPLGLAAVSIIIALAAVAVIGQQFQLVFFVTLMVVMLGLAVGIDYSLLIVSRFKEEMRHGMSTKDAVAKTGGTAGRTVLFSGATVVLALVGLLIVPASFYQSLALGAILVVIASLAATLTLLPAVLALLGPKVDLLTIPFLTRFSLKGADTSQGGFWDKITHIVTKQPVISLLIVGRADDRAFVFLPGDPHGSQRREHLPRQGRDEEGLPPDGREVLLWDCQPGGVPEPGGDRRLRQHRRPAGNGSHRAGAAVIGGGHHVPAAPAAADSKRRR